jgi:hypothetical protein
MTESALLSPIDTCANCGAAITPTHRYCGMCGQKSPTKRLRSHDVLHDLVHAFVHMDHSIFTLLRALILRPGVVAREYINGHRKRYFGPFAFLVIVVGVASIVMQATGYLIFSSSNSAAPRGNVIALFLQRNINLVILLQVPIIAAMCALLFRQQKRHYVEHVVLAAYMSGIRSLFFIVVIIPLWYLLRPTGYSLWLTYAYLLLWAIYFGYGASAFYTGHRGWLWVKGMLAAVLTQAITIAIVSLVSFIYFRWVLPQ